MRLISDTQFDVIDLVASQNEDDDDDDKSAASQTDEANEQTTLDFTEVTEALHNNIWSNVQYPKSITESNNMAALSEDDVEHELEAFEHLLTQLQQFKALSQNMNRNDMLDQAEKLAQHFDNLLYGDD